MEAFCQLWETNFTFLLVLGCVTSKWNTNSAVCRGPNTDYYGNVSL